MTSHYSHLFTSFAVGQISVKNRFVFLPHATGFVTSEGLPDERQHRYLVERARGGVGLVIEGGPAVHKTASVFAVANGWDERIVPLWKKTAEAVHNCGAKIFCQPHIAGAEMPGGRHRLPIWAPSSVPDPAGGNEIPKQMETEDIAELIAGYLTVARHAQEAGYDGLELKACHNGLLREFWSPANNSRTDHYGGTLENRMHLVLELLASLRRAARADFVIGVRICLDELKPGGYGLDEGLEISRMLTDSGYVDYLSADVGTMSPGAHICGPSMSLPLGCNVWAAAALRNVTTLPVIAAARINDPVQAENILADGHADLIGMARQLLCDPETPNKARENRHDEIRHCMGCNQGCFGGLYNINLRHITCVQNPRVGYEKEQGHPTTVTTAERKNVMVVGGGPAGMKAAEVAALRGHTVELYEKETQLGGQVRIAATGPNRTELEEVTHWLERQIRHLGVEIHTGVEVTAPLVTQKQPDAVVVATGAYPEKPRSIKGTEQDNVLSAWDIHQGAPVAGGRVIVYSEWRGHAAISAAQILADQGVAVEIVTPMLFVGQDIDIMSLTPVCETLLEKAVTLTPQTALVSIAGTTVTLLNVFSHQITVRDDVDAIVLSTPARANDTLYFSLKGRVSKLYRIGDCLAPRNLASAIVEGERAGATV